MHAARTSEAKITNYSQVRDDRDRLGWGASKLWNVAQYYADERWEASGIVPAKRHTFMYLCAQCMHMGSSTRVHFRAPERLIEQADVLAVAEDKNRTDVLIDALRDYLEEASDEEHVRQAIANAYYEDQLTFEQVKAIVGMEDAQNFRVLKRQLTDDSISDDLAAALDE
jgi:hypothetical protein